MMFYATGIERGGTGAALAQPTGHSPDSCATEPHATCAPETRSESMQNASIVVIGCSAGCVPALMTLVKDFDADWPAAIFVTVHIGRRRSRLPQLLGEQCPMPVSHATEGMPIGRGHVYIAPP